MHHAPSPSGRVTVGPAKGVRYRARATHPERKLPAGRRGSLAAAAWGGLQDSVPRGGVIAGAPVDAFHANLTGDDLEGYVNVIDDEGEQRIRAAHPHGTYDRLAALKGPLRPIQPVPPQPEHPPVGVTACGDAPFVARVIAGTSQPR